MRDLKCTSHTTYLIKIVMLFFCSLFLFVPRGGRADFKEIYQENVANLQELDLVSVDGGWVLIGQQLYWTKTGGQHWINITPPNKGQLMIQAVSFLDTQHGWLILTKTDKGGNVTYALARTFDTGKNWQIKELSLFEPGDVNSLAGAVYLQFIDTNVGWLVIKRATSSNFSKGTLFKTMDGGDTWTQLSIPIGEPVYFVTNKVGWTAGGATGNELYRTQDGGLSWHPQTIGRPLAPNTSQRKLYQLPTFVNAYEGVLPVILTDGNNTEVEFYVTQDSGQSWNLATHLSMSQEVAPGTHVPLAVFDIRNWLMIMPNSNRLFKKSGRSKTMRVISQDPMIAGITELDMVTPRVGWAKYMSGRYIPALGYILETKLLRTNDGGQTWAVLKMPHPDSPRGEGSLITPRILGGAGNWQHFEGQGFDKCEIPSLNQLQNWITNSPYRAVNLYIGGSCRSCPNSALTNSYILQLSQQGWVFIPTWVGPQSTCSGICPYYDCNCISDDPTVAYNQGISEANTAIDVAANLGLTGTIIYYDLEAYNCSVNPTCLNAAKSFISGWTAQLHARGYLSGVYGSSCSSCISDFATISNVPDAVWPAHWIYSSYNPNATVWDVGCLSNDLWVDHQRIRQYTGGHNESWGNITLNIDCDAIDGIVAITAPGYAAVSEGVTVTPSPIYVGDNFNVTFTLKEIQGAPITFAEVTCAILDNNDNLQFDLQKFSNVTVPANETWTYTGSGYMGSQFPPGTYKAMARGRVTNWFDFTTTGSGVNPCVFEVQERTPPTLISPPNGSHQTCSITFQWSSVSGATNYRLYLLLPGSSSWLSDETTSTSYPFSPTVMGEYHWKVKAYVGGDWSDYSEEWTFYFDGVVAPTLTSPTNGSQITELRPTFQWNSVACANYYGLQLARNSSFTDIVRDNPTIYGTSWQLDNQDLVPGQTYYWRVRSNSPIGHWSDIWHFTVLPHTVNTPNTPSGPSEGCVGQSLTYSTGGSSCSYGHSVEYRFDWEDGMSSWGSASGSHSWSTAGTYCVKAQARCAVDHSIVSSWSGCKSVTISTTPAAPSNCVASDNLCDKVRICWQDNSNNEDGFKIYRNGSYIGGVGANVTCYDDNTASPGVTYSYCVKAYNECDESSQSCDNGIRLAPPAAPSLSSPSNGAIDQSVPVYLDWYEVSGVDNYQVMVDSNSSFSSPQIDETTSSSYYNATGLDIATTYYWRVRAHNICDWGAWSAKWHFTTVTTGVDDESSLQDKPVAFALSQNYPNPFNPETVIEYALPKDCQVQIAIYNLLGQKIRTLIEQYQTKGQKKVLWDGKDNQGNELTSGIYFYRLQAGDFSQTKKMVLLR